MNPKDRGYTVLTILYSPTEDLTSSDHFNPAQQKPLKGSLERLIYQTAKDLHYIAGTNAPTLCKPLLDLFSELMTLDNTNYSPHLMFNPTKSNSYCDGNKLRKPFLQKLWAVTDASRGRHNDEACKLGVHFDVDDEMEHISDPKRSAQPGVCDPLRPQLHVKETSLKRKIDNLTPGAGASCKSSKTMASTVTTDLKLDATRDRIQKIVGDPNHDDFPWSTTENFNPEWTNLLKSQTQILPLAEINNVKHW